MNDWDPRENPLVQRAMRTGFRSGLSGYRINLWITGLVIVTGGPFLPKLFDRGWDLRDSMSWMFALVFILLILAFLVGGFQRMLSAFSNERERGTFEFLHLSTMRSDGIVAGFLMSGQLPGYFAMVLLAPLLVVSSLILDYSLAALAVLLVAVVLYILFISVLMLYLGYWSKKVAEFRSMALLYVLFYFILASFVYRGFDNLKVLPPDWSDILHGFSFLKTLYLGVTGGGGPAVVVFEPVFFGWSVPSVVALVLVLGPPTVFLFLTLTRSLRHREGRGCSETHGLLMFGWINFLLIGIWWESDTPTFVRVQTLLIVAWICIAHFFRRNTITRGGTILALSRREGTINLLSSDTEACPPYRFGLLLFLVHLTSFMFLLGVGTGASVSDLASNIFLAPLLFVLPLLLYCSLIQWLVWRTPSWKGGERVISALFVWVPYFVYLTARGLPLQDVLGDGYKMYGLISPFSQVQELFGSVDGGGILMRVIGLQFFCYGSAAILLFVSVLRYWRLLNKRREQLSESFDPNQLSTAIDKNQ